MVKKKKLSKKDKNPPREKIKKKPEKKELSPSFSQFIDEYIQILSYKKEAEVSPIHVDDLTSKIASFYEKIRMIIDWKEEHLIRRFAIERTLRRKMISQISGISIISDLKAGKIAKPLVTELIRKGHFENDKISKRRIKYVEKVLSKYIYILQNSVPTRNALSINIKSKVQYYNWILSIAACEIEEILKPAYFENALINFMTHRIFERIKVKPGNIMNDERKFYQTYIAVHRALYNLDPPIIIYHLIKCHYPKWIEQTEVILKSFSQKLEDIYKYFEKELMYNKSGKFYGVCEQYDTVYLVIGDILTMVQKDTKSIKSKFEKLDSLEKLIKEVYDKRLSTLRRRLRRSAVFSTLSIFLASSVSLFVIEVPIAKMFYGKFSIFALAMDIIVPTLFMFIFVALIKLPKKSNFKRVLSEVKKVIYKRDEIDVYEIDLRRKKNFIKNIIFTLIFIIFGITSLLLIFMLFKFAGIPWTSMYIDTINIAVIVFAALVVRQRAREMTVEESSNLFEFVLDLIAIPIAKIGQWFSMKWKEYNFVSVFFTALVDTPFVKILDVFEDWRNYLKEKKAGIH